MRTAILTIRDERAVPWFGSQLDAEDALVRTLGAALHRVRAGRGYDRGPLASGHTRRVMSWSRLLRPVRVHPGPERDAERADVLLVLLNDLHDASLLLSEPRWHELGEVVLMHLAEVNERHLRLYPEVVRHLRRRVDHLFVSVPGEWMSALPGRRLRTVDQLPVPLDVLVFAPRPWERRAIDVFNPGRRHPAQHAALRSWADREDRFYLHDTGYLAGVESLPEHRAHYRSLAVRSRVFVTNYAAVGAAARRTFPARMIGTRSYEAMAAGCVAAGDLPEKADRQDEVAAAEPVRWPVGERAPSPDLLRVLDDPVEWARRSAAARITALAVADVAHRWGEMAERAGLPTHPGMTERLARLHTEAVEVRAAIDRTTDHETSARTG